MYNLSKPQQTIYDMSKVIGGSISTICGSMLKEGAPDIDLLKKSVNELYRLNDALRIHIKEIDGQPMQYVKNYSEMDIEVLQFESETDFSEYANKIACQHMSLYADLAEISVVIIKNKYGIIAKLHHIIGDAWTLTLLAQQYNELINGNTPKAYSYIDYLGAENQYINSNRYENDKKYWLNIFNQCDEVTYLNEKEIKTYKSNRKTYIVDKNSTAKIQKYTNENGASVYSLFMALFAVYINRIKFNCEKFYIGTAVLNRTGLKEKNTMGMYINTVPLLIDISNNDTFADCIEKISDNSSTMFRHQKYNYMDILKDIREKYAFNEMLYDVIFSYQNAKVASDNYNFTTEWYCPGMQTESLQIHIDDRDNEGILKIHYDYLTDKFTEQDIEHMHEHMFNLLYDAVKYKSKKICELNILSNTEKNKLLYEFNDTKVDYPMNKCVHQLFEEQTATTPGKTAVVACDKTLTYDELNKLSNRIANALVEKGIGKGDIVAFALPRRSYLIATMLGILKSGAAYMPIDPDYPQDRIEYMLADSGAKLFITDENITEYMSDSEENPNVKMISDSLCYCIYTSGSTGKPKGTLLHHKGIVNLVTNLGLYKDLSKCKVFGFLTTITFDVATQEILTALLNGFTGCLMPERSKSSVEEISNGIVQNKIDIIYATPSYFDTLTSITENAEKLLSQLKVVALAGEKFYLNNTVKELRNKYKTIFENQYGPVELHVIATATTVVDNDFTSIGRVVANDDAYIVDRYNNILPIGQIGELCIAGDGVGAGYLNRPELTAEKFIDNPFGEGKLYKTGDLAYWREDGNIMFVGRNDFQVKIRGLRIELGEIENAICSTDGISQAVVVVRKDESGRQLICAFYTEKSAVDIADIKKTILDRLPKYMLPHIFTRLDEMPLTPSGKINRKALPEVDLHNISNEVEYIEPKTETEKLLVSEIGQILSLSKISVLDNFFDIGGDSLKAIELLSKLEAHGFTTTVKNIFDSENIQALSNRLEATEKSEDIFVYDGDIPATSAQMRVYTAQNMNANSTMYNVPYAFKVKSLDADRLQAAVNKMIERHEILRTHFENKDGQIIQTINKNAVCKVEQLKSDDALSFIRPFDLSNAPLIRVGYYENTIMLDMHHIITDGGSMPVFLNELNDLYMGRELNNAPVQYKQFSVEKQDYANSKNYWLSIYNEELPELEINTDVPRGQKQSFTGSAVYDTIDIALHNKIIEKCKNLNITPFVFYMSAFNILLSKFSGNEDIIVGMPISGRKNKYLNTIGMFVNTIALRNNPTGSKRVLEFLNEVKENSINAIANQDYPFGELVKELKIDVQNRNPLFDVMFAYQSEEMTDVIFGDEQSELLPVPITTSKYDFTFNIMPRENDVVLMVEYCTDLYDEKTINRFIDSYKRILTAILDEKQFIYDISAISKEEEHRILYEFNDTKADYPKDKCVHQLFEEQAAKTPDKTAVIACDKTLTYDELNKLSNRIANALIEKGIGIGDIVAFALPRRSYLIATMFGILKSGAAYMPIDPDYPQDRIEYMLADSNAKLFITDNNIDEYVSENEQNPNVKMTSDNYCYCIYTSGSTGKPKGTLLHHKGIINLVTNLNLYKDLSKCDVFGFLTTITFDVATQEILTALLNGFTGCLLPERSKSPVEEISNGIVQNKIDIIYATPSYFDMLTSTAENARRLLGQLKIVSLAGEKFYLNNTVKALRDKYNTIFENQYGPVELHVIAAATTVVDDDFTSIGRVVANDTAYILDKYNKILPIGQIGELCIAGDGVGAGYLNRPELTAEKFIDNPFGEGKLYKTGDLAYWREDGNIMFVGRNDFQVKIRGLRIELGEIENAICSTDGVSQAVVVVREDENERQLICAFYTEKSEVDVADIKKTILDRLPKYMLPHIFTRLDEMPLTPSGKISRKALPEVDLSQIDNNVEYVAAATERERLLVSAISQILSLSRVSMLDNFFDIGGDSLKAIELVSKLETDGFTVDIKSIFDAENLKELAEILKKSNISSIQTLEFNGDIPATPAQMRVYTAQNMNVNMTTYNIPYVFKADNVDINRLQTAFEKLIERHESLRTHFENKDGKIIQIIDNTVDFEIERLVSDSITDFVRPFNLAKAPLMRVGVYKNTVIIDMHHIITDGSSMPIIIRELNELYMGRSLKDKPVQYREFALEKKDTTENEKYWLSIYNYELPELEIQTDFPRDTKQSFNGNAIYDTLDIELHNKIKTKCKSLNVTPYTYYMSAFNILLSKFSGNEDIIVGMPISGRASKYLNTVGMFVNTIALRNKPVGTKSVIEFVNEVKENSINAIVNQDYPYGELVKKLNFDAQGRNPLFDVMFAYQSEEITDVIFGDEKAEILSVPITTSKYDFTFNIMPRENDIVLMVEYCTDLYKENTINRMITGFKLILQQMLTEDSLIMDICAISKQEMNKLLYEFNDTKADYPKDKCVHQLFEEQAAKTPDKTAVIACDKTLTYDELNKLANRIANALIAKGVGVGDIVAFALPRRSYLIAVMFGILKSGAAYMPIDPDYPQDRINYLLTESKAKIFITNNELTKFLKNNNEENPDITIIQRNAYCALHTSGSTGKPKLALLSHKNVMNFLYANQRFYNGVDATVSATIVTFDIFIQDTVLSIAVGVKTVLSSEEQIYNQYEFEKLFSDTKSALFFATPTKLKQYINGSQTKEFLNHIGVFVVGGEVFTEELYNLMLNNINISHCYNGYGPAETTIGSSYALLTPPPKIYNIYGPTEASICVSISDILFER